MTRHKQLRGPVLSFYASALLSSKQKNKLYLTNKFIGIIFQVLVFSFKGFKALPQKKNQPEFWGKYLMDMFVYTCLLSFCLIFVWVGVCLHVCLYVCMFVCLYVCMFVPSLSKKSSYPINIIFWFLKILKFFKHKFFRNLKFFLVNSLDWD